MDPGLILGEAAKYGLGVMLLVAAVIYLVRRDNRMQAEDRTRTIALIADNRKECLEREDDLSQRLRAVEDRSHGENAELLRLCATALKTNADTFARLVDHDTGQHRALNGRKD